MGIPTPRAAVVAAIDLLESRQLFAAGTLAWASGVDGLVVAAQATDAAGNVYVAGTVRGSADLNLSPRKTYRLTAVDTSFGAAVVAKYTAAGALVWARLLSDANLTGPSVVDVAVDRSTGDLLITGQFRGTYSFAKGIALTSRDSSFDAYW